MAADWTPPADNPFAPLPPEVALARINDAIYTVETKGQMYRIGDRQLLRGDLRWMYPERARLEKLVASRLRGGIRMRRVVPL